MLAAAEGEAKRTGSCNNRCCAAGETGAWINRQLGKATFAGKDQPIFEADELTRLSQERDLPLTDQPQPARDCIRKHQVLPR
jgi:hypothetical protein